MTSGQPTPLRERERALAAIRQDVAQRLRSVCAAWPEDETAQLVARIAEIKYKYEVLLDRDIWVSPADDNELLN